MGLNISPRINQSVMERFFHRAIIALVKERATMANAAQAQIVMLVIVSTSPAQAAARRDVEAGVPRAEAGSDG